jgi:hypothetical protein
MPSTLSPDLVCGKTGRVAQRLLHTLVARPPSPDRLGRYSILVPRRHGILIALTDRLR